MLRIHRTSPRVRASRLRMAKNVASEPLGDGPRRPAGTISVGNTRSIVVRLGAHTRWVSVASVATGRQIRPAKSPIGRSSYWYWLSPTDPGPEQTRPPSSLLDVEGFDETKSFAAVVWTSRRSSSLGNEYESCGRSGNTRPSSVNSRVKVQLNSSFHYLNLRCK